MKIFTMLCLSWVVATVNPVTADDTEAYLPGGWREGVYLSVVMDIGDASQDTVLCTYGVDCGPPFMTALAHRHLAAMYSLGDAVTAAGIFRAVLAAVIEHTQLDDVYLSLLISNHQDNSIEPEQRARGGGTVLAGYQPIRQHRAGFIALLESIAQLSAPETHLLQPKETYFEWLRYIRGGDVALGQNTVGNFGRTAPSPDYDANIILQGRYQAPIDEAHACPALFSLLYTQGSSGRDEDLNSEIAAQLSLTLQTTFTELLTYLHSRSTDLLPQVDATVPLTKSWMVTTEERAGEIEEQAKASGGSVFLVNAPLQLEADLIGALAGIVAARSSHQNPVFVEDVFNRGQILNDVFIPMFSAQSRSNWHGNLKKLKLKSTRSEAGDPDAQDITVKQLFDVHAQPAIEVSGENKGRLRADTLTFWTDVGSLPAGDGGNISDMADGRVVARGGAGQKMDGFVGYSDGQGGSVRYFIGDSNADAATGGYTPRQVYYEPLAGPDFAPFNADAITVDALSPLLDPYGELTEDALANLIRWARGQNVDSDVAQARNWLMGELLHSRPLALNYGATPGYSAANPNVRLLFGSGEGAFHIVENTDSRGRQSGRELFAFFPLASLATIRWRHDVDPTAQALRYGVDGTPVVLKYDRNGDGTIDHAAGDEAIVYFGMRRGGSSYFALDVSNPDALPRLLWKIEATSGGAFDELGLTFSTPLVGKVNFSGVPEDVLIFAGGYNGGWNRDFTARVGKDLGADDDAVGNAIYIVNAHTGELVWKAVAGDTGISSNTQYAHAGLVDSIPSEVAALVTPAGILHRLYVGDTGGAVWRVDLPPVVGDNDNHRRDHWFITKLADLGFDAAEPGGSDSADRRFFHAPDIVQSFDDVGEFDGVLIQSGNRADPNETAVANGLFYIKDRNTESGSALVQAENEVSRPAGRYHYAQLEDQTDCIVSVEGSHGGCSDSVFPNGWIVRFVEAGEKGLSSPITDAGRVFASTFVPGDATSCPVRQGQGRLHVLHLGNATAVANTQRVYELGEGIPDGAELVGDVIFIPGGGIDLYDLDGDGTRDIATFLPSQAIKMYRTYWREPGIDPL